VEEVAVSFAHPHLLWSLLLVVPGLIAFFWWAWQKKQELIAQFISARLLPQLTVGVAPARQKARVALLVAAVALLVIVLARPQIGFSWEEARSRGLDILIAIDTSRSMLATDVAPNRLRRAQLAALDLKRLARTDRLGLVAFAGSAFLQCPLTLDDEAFRQSVEALDVNIIPQGGTAIAEAILAAKGAFKEGNDNHKVVVLFTDGEDHDGNGVEVAKQAAKDGLTIFTVGVGTPGGELLRTVDVQGRTEFIKDPDGNAVKSRLNEDLLRDIARETGGYFMLLSGAKAMDLLYENRLAPLPKGDLASQRIKRPHERYQWLLGLVLVLLVIEMLLPERKPAPKSNAGPATSAALTAPTAVRQSGAASPAVTSPRAKLVASILLLVAFVFLACTARASSSEGLKQYQKGRYDRAVLEYESALRKQPDDPRLHFNAGTAAFQTKDYDQAVSHLNSALLTQDLPLQHRTYYNLGNTQFRQGEDASDLDKRRQLWEQAIRSYDSAVSLDAKDADAQFNRELVKQKLEELKQQQQQQKQQQGDKNMDGQQDKNKQDSKDQQQQQDQSKKQDGKDQQKKDQQDQQKQQQQDQQAKNKEEQKKKEQQSKDGQQSQQGKQDKDGQEKNAQQAQQDQGDQGDQQDGTPARAVRMTPQQAVQLLEALKGEERVMTFRPLRTNRQDRVFKDW
jgi:Ca-activated chloride channel family protein